IANIFPQFYKQNEDQTAYLKSYNKFYIPVPKEPYTPEITSLSMDYKAKSAGNQPAFFHLYPFGQNYQQFSLKAENPDLLPPFTDEGNLFIGINNLRPGSVLHLLFQMAESTADPFTEQAVVRWSFLANNTWIPLEQGFDILSDETNGLIKSGIIDIKIPRNINRENTILSPELFWLKVSVYERAIAISETIDIHTQAARVRFVNRGNDLERLAKPLEAGTITEAVDSFEEIEAVNQFYDSFGGRPEEKNISFYTRVSERLRHKGRAVTLFDYERLVLEHFPQIYKTKCITHTLGRMAGASQDNHLAAGFVVIAVIPNLQKIPSANRLKPRANVALLKDIEKLIRKKTSPFVRLKVLNPDYENINLSGKISFVEGGDETFLLEKLKQDIQQFLAPWAFDPVASIAFGGRIFRSTILGFIEKQPYIEYVKDFAMFGSDKKNVAEITATSARSILVPGRMNFTATECCYPSTATT
ncbi:MAG: baseplate J/gp47 family protein, partial [Bacteroidetes bacterium]|nr:baseplate J/gp47 family protein [Bacteroidota bacterium]